MEPYKGACTEPGKFRLVTEYMQGALKEIAFIFYYLFLIARFIVALFTGGTLEMRLEQKTALPIHLKGNALQEPSFFSNPLTCTFPDFINFSVLCQRYCARIELVARNVKISAQRFKARLKIVPKQD